MTGLRWRGRWGSVLAVGLPMGVFVGSVQQAVHGLWGEPWDWAVMAVYVVVWAVVVPPLLWLVHRAIARGTLPQDPAARVRAQRSELVRPAMRAGTLPSDADPSTWRRALDDQVREWQGQRWLDVVVTVGVPGLIGVAAAHANHNDWRVWAMAVVVAVEGVVALRWSGQRLRTARSLRAELATR